MRVSMLLLCALLVGCNSEPDRTGKAGPGGGTANSVTGSPRINSGDGGEGSGPTGTGGATPSESGGLPSSHK